MTIENNLKSIAQAVKVHEGFRTYIYKDTVGKMTIGYGHNIEDNGLSTEICEAILVEDLGIAAADCAKLFPKFDTFSLDVQKALVSMSFNLGLPRLSLFKKMIAAVNKGDFKTASTHALDSKWAIQLPQRATEIAMLLGRNSDVQS